MAEPWEFDTASLDTTPEIIAVGSIEIPARVAAWLRAGAAYSETTLNAEIADVLTRIYDDQYGYRADVEASLRLLEDQA